MAYLRCALVGLVTGAGTVVIWVLLSLLSVFLAFHSLTGQGAGGVGAVSVGVSEGTLLQGLVGFALGFYLMLRRQRARRIRAQQNP